MSQLDNLNRELDAQIDKHIQYLQQLKEQLFDKPKVEMKPFQLDLDAKRESLITRAPDVVINNFGQAAEDFTASLPKIPAVVE